jgi:hypothetical protein
MYRFGDNPSHALISLTPIVDDSGAQVEWPFMAALSRPTHIPDRR